MDRRPRRLRDRSSVADRLRAPGILGFPPAIVHREITDAPMTFRRHTRTTGSKVAQFLACALQPYLAASYHLIDSTYEIVEDSCPLLQRLPIGSRLNCRLGLRHHMLHRAHLTVKRLHVVLEWVL